MARASVAMRSSSTNLRSALLLVAAVTLATLTFLVVAAMASVDSDATKLTNQSTVTTDQWPTLPIYNSGRSY